MATLTFSYDTGNVTIARIVDSMALTYGYQTTIINAQGQVVPNPQSKAEFGKAIIRDIIVDAVKNADLQEARRLAEEGVTPITIT